jgi:hypothetical protein
MKTKTPKTRVMWANYYPKFVGAPSIYPDRERAEQAAAGCTTPVRVAVIPLDDIEAIRDRVSEAIANQNGFTLTPDAPGIKYRAMADAALTSAGIPCLKRKARK